MQVKMQVEVQAAMHDATHVAMHAWTHATTYDTPKTIKAHVTVNIAESNCMPQCKEHYHVTV